MSAIDTFLSSFNPLDDQRVYSYAIFFVDGKIPFEHRDLQLLFDEWKTISPATLTRRYSGIRATGGATYDQRWTPEKAKIFKLFDQFSQLEAEGKRASICIVYPETETEWTPTTNRTVHSMRGHQLATLLKSMSHTSDIGVTLVVHYYYKDTAETFKVPLNRGLIHEQISSELMASLNTVTIDKGFSTSTTFTTEPIPLEALHDFWTVFRNSDDWLLAKYGQDLDAISPAYEKFKGLYANEATGFKGFFKRFSLLDSQIEQSKLIVACFNYDTGYQYAILRHEGRFTFAKLPSTGSSKMLGATAPKDKRMVVKIIYIEP